MSLNEFLKSRENTIRRRWFERIAGTYPDKTAVFLTRKNNQFENPVGYILTTNVEIIFHKFLEEAELEEFQNPLNEIIKIRSVQGFSPSQAISFIYLLKDVIRNEVRDEIADWKAMEGLIRIEDRIDRLACAAFDLYMQSREQIYQLRVNEVKRIGFRLLQKAKLISPDGESDTPLT